MENGTWAPMAAKVMRSMLEKSSNLSFASHTVTLHSAMNDANAQQIEALADELCKNYIGLSDELANKQDFRALFNIGYGLYVVTSNDGKRDNGLIVNTVTQVTDTPNRVAVTINKQNYSHHIIKQTGQMNVNCLSVSAPFEVISELRIPKRKNRGQVRRKGIAPDGQRPCRFGSVCQCGDVPQSRTVCGFGHAWNVYLQCNRVPCAQR